MRRIHVKNLLALSVTFFLIQSAFLALQNLASSLYASGGLGLASLATIYAFYAISCLLAPVLIRFIGTKWALVAAVCTYCVYIAINFYPDYFTLIPAAALLGMGAGPMWSSQGTHLTTSAINLADITLETHEAVINRFNGVFNLIFLAGQIPGNLVSSLVLYKDFDGGHLNETDLGYCGANGCGNSPASNSSVNNAPDQRTAYMLFGTLLAWGALAVPTAAFFMDPLESYCTVLPVKRSALKQLKATFRLSLSPKMYLLIPLIFYNGIELGFGYGDFTKAFVSCTQGLQSIGFVMTAYGISGGISALTLGIINKYTGRIPIFTAGFITHMILMIAMIFWDPYKSEMWQLYLMAVVWAFGAALRESQIGAVVGVLFPKDQEPAFANFRFWQAISYTVSFASSIPDVVCILYKMIALICGLCIAMGLYYRLEWRLRHDLATDPRTCDLKYIEKDTVIKSKVNENNSEELDVFLPNKSKHAVPDLH